MTKNTPSRARRAPKAHATAARPRGATVRRSVAPDPVTPLAARLKAPARATPQALFELALQKWEQGERFDIGKMAQELGVSRATVFRWVGSRELLYGEVLSTQFQAALAMAAAEAEGTGAELIADVSRRLLRALLEHEPLRRFVQQDSEYAIRVLLSKTSTVEQRCAAYVREALEHALREGRLRTPAMPLNDLAYLIVRIGESFLYRDAITGEEPDIEPAVLAIKILVATEKA